MNALSRYLRPIVRSLTRSPGFTAVVVLTLAIGIAANTTIFSAVNALLLRPLPYPQPERLLTIHHYYPSLDGLEAPVSASGFRLYRDETKLFSHMAVVAGGGANLTGSGEPERVEGARVSAQFFDVFGVKPFLGRAPLAEEDTPGRNKVVVLTHGFWQRRFGGDPSVIGRKLMLNGDPHEIIGVMPASFQYFWSPKTELIRPLALTPEQLSSRTTEYLNLAARLKPGVTMEQAREEMSRFSGRVREAFPDEYPPDWELTVKSLDEVQKGELREPLLILVAAVGFVLLIGCANVANLMLARAMGRTREVAIRSAVGAGRMQIIAQLLSESLVLSLIGGALGLLLAAGGVAVLSRAVVDQLPPGVTLGVDATVLAFTFFLSVLTGLAFGLGPALHASRVNLQAMLREGGRGLAGDRLSNLTRRALVVGEVAVALTLLAGAGLLIRSLAHLQNVDPGFRPSNVLTFNLSLPGTKYSTDAARVAFFDELRQRLESTPGVTAAGLTSVLPFSGGWSTGSFAVEGHQPAQNEPDPWGDYRIVSPGYDRALGMTVLRGRFFDERDHAGAPTVAVVDEELARRYWPNEDPIGKRITEDPGADSVVWIPVIGVVRHTKHAGLDDDDRVQLYFSYRQMPGVGGLAAAVRTTGDPLAMVGTIRQVIHGIDPDQPLAEVQSMDAMMDRSLGARRLSVSLLTLFSALATLLAAIGIYGVISHMVTLRTRELGVRMALGAATGSVIGMVMRQGVGLALAGVGLGLLGALGLTRLISAQLFGVEPTDPVTFGITAALLVLVAVVATLLPAGRAARVDPVVALRSE